MKQERMTILWFLWVFCAMLVPANMAPADPPKASSFTSTTPLQSNVVAPVSVLAEASKAPSQKDAQQPEANAGLPSSQADQPPVENKEAVSNESVKQPAQLLITRTDVGVADNKSSAGVESPDKSKPIPPSETTVIKDQEAPIQKVQEVAPVPSNPSLKQAIAGEGSMQQEGVPQGVPENAPEQDKVRVTENQQPLESSTEATTSKSNDTQASETSKDSQQVDQQSQLPKAESSKGPEVVEAQPSNPTLQNEESENKETGKEAVEPEPEQEQTQIGLKEEEAGSDIVIDSPNEAEPNTMGNQMSERPREEEENDFEMQAPIEENLGDEEENTGDAYDESSQSSMMSNMMNGPSSYDQPETQDRQEKGESTIDGGGAFKNDEDSHFFAYFLTIMVLAIIFYLVFHNKQRIIALIIEGRSPGSRRGRRSSSRGKYHKLDNNLEEAMTATKGANT